NYISSMERRVSRMDSITVQTETMNREMQVIAQDLTQMEGTIGGIRNHMTEVRGKIDNISVSINQMNGEVQMMGQDMHRMGQPARTMNKMFPFP
ncbi:translation initiation factor 2, partial [Candidatus Endoriftia persephone str. Guaymas]|nr:translation initiation factor 2 [Candidatus Endoriftia persephone str. Guaymas]